MIGGPINAITIYLLRCHLVSYISAFLLPSLLFNSCHCDFLTHLLIAFSCVQYKDIWLKFNVFSTLLAIHNFYIFSANDWWFAYIATFLCVDNFSSTSICDWWFTMTAFLFCYRINSVSDWWFAYISTSFSNIRWILYHIWSLFLHMDNLWWLFLLRHLFLVYDYINLEVTISIAVIISFERKAW